MSAQHRSAVRVDLGHADHGVSSGTYTEIESARSGAQAESPHGAASYGWRGPLPAWYTWVMAAPTTDRPSKPYVWNNDHHVQFRLAERAYTALEAEAYALGVTTNIAAKLLITQRLDPQTHREHMRQLRDPEVYRLDDPYRES